MARVEKTVFLSYRRANASWALAIYQNLTANGFDVFFDYKGIASGDFESVILVNIRASAHFLVALTPSALERCADPGDWLRREIEEAIECRRNIVPLLLEGFDFGASAVASQLTGRLAELKKYNGLTLPVEYFDAAMERLREKFLNVPVDTVLHRASAFAREAAKEQQTAAGLLSIEAEKRKQEEERLPETGHPPSPPATDSTPPAPQVHTGCSLALFQRVYEFAATTMYKTPHDAEMFANLWVQNYGDVDFAHFKEAYKFAVKRMHKTRHDAEIIALRKVTNLL